MIWLGVVLLDGFFLTVIYFGIRIIRNPRDAWKWGAMQRKPTNSDLSMLKRDALVGILLSLVMLVLVTAIGWVWFGKG